MQDASSATTPSPTERVSFGGGCFWCIEAIFRRVEGVIRATSGYQGGGVEDPTYEEVCAGGTGHVEVVQVEYDPTQVTFAELLGKFWAAHDPTTPNRQGHDVGTQYRSVIYTYTEAQQAEAVASKVALEESGEFDAPIVTAIAWAPPFYEAEGYHQDYYEAHRDAPYCALTITPKLKKLGMLD